MKVLHCQTDRQGPGWAEGDIRADVQEVDGNGILSGLEPPASLLIRRLDGLIVQCGLGGSSSLDLDQPVEFKESRLRFGCTCTIAEEGLILSVATLP